MTVKINDGLVKHMMQVWDTELSNGFFADTLHVPKKSDTIKFRRYEPVTCTFPADVTPPLPKMSELTSTKQEPEPPIEDFSYLMRPYVKRRSPF